MYIKLSVLIVAWSMGCIKIARHDPNDRKCTRRVNPRKLKG